MPAPYSPSTIYDAPGVIFSSLLDGELTGPTFRSAMMDSMSLTPAERDTISERLKQASGNHAISNALIDTALNPWVWFAFITSPIATSALARTGRGIFDIAAENTVFQRKIGSLLSILGATTPVEDLAGSSLGSGLRQVVKGFEQLAAEEIAVIGAPRDALLKRTGTKTLEWENVFNPRKRELVRKLNATIFAKLGGWDKDWEEIIAYVDKAGEAVVSARPHLKKVTANLDDTLRELGGEEAVTYANALKDAMKQRIQRVFPDDDAILRAWRLIRNPSVQSHTEAGVTTGRDIIKLMMGDVFESVQAGRMSPEKFKEIVTKVVKAPLNNENYVPQNIWENWVNGRRLESRLNPQDISQLRPGGFAMNRSFNTGLYHPKDSQYIYDLLGGTDELKDEVLKAQQLLEEGGATRFLRSDIDRSTSRYMDDTARTYAFTQKPDEELLAAQAMSREKIAQTQFPQLKESYDPPLGALTEAHSTRTAIKDANVVPPGGFSVADSLFGDYLYMADETARNRFINIWMPMATGRMPAKSGAMLAAVDKTKEWTRALVQTDAIKQIAKSGGGQEFIDTLANWAKSPIRVGEGSVTARSVSNWLYASHLGLNMSSVVLNLTQPFLLASTWLGAGNVMKAYGKAMGELLEYGQARAQQGFRALSEAEKYEMFRKHFAHAELIGIGPKLMETIEGSALSGARGQFGKEGLFRRTTQFMMKPFETAELLNRLVAGHATIEAYKGAGRAVLSGGGQLLPEVAADIRRVAQQTQFGGSFLNTPTMFQTGWLNNPLLRQFMSFQVRSFTGLAETSRRIGGRTGWNSAMGPLFDFGRSMGISAVIYEAGKNLLHTDMSRGLAFSAATDILPGFAGGRFDESDSILPVPPIIDIPFNLFTAAASGDMELAKRQLPRVIPGGVALARMLGGAPKVPLPDPFNLQSTYVGWKQMVTGPNGDRLVPVFKGDGTLLDWQNPSAVVLRSMGADLGGRTATLDIDKYIMSQSDLIREYRGRALTKLMANDVSGFNSIRDEFKKRTGLPLTISQAHLASAIKQREVPRYERVLGRIPEDLRAPYQEMLAGQASYRSGITGLPGGKDAQRPQATPMTLQGAQALIGEAEASNPGYASYEGFKP